jgi:1-deoxy-D-xylulose-5-phosphate reductoisomerase
MNKKPQKIVIIGSTGSLGKQSLDVIKDNPGDFQVHGLACFQNIHKLHEQIQEFLPKTVAVYDAAAGIQLAKKLQEMPRKIRPRIFIGEKGWQDIATEPNVDKILFLSNGVTAFPTLQCAIKRHKRIAIANKELLVAYGQKIMKEARKNKVTIIPVDSEHSAIFQCLQGEDPKNIEKIILTCSGGPFLGKNAEELKKVTFQDAINHPVWEMGTKISVDSATLINKGFEVIEAIHLFNLRPDQIEVVIHPEGVFHSFVQFKDGSIKAQLSKPDMRFAIHYALSYPKRTTTQLPRLSFSELNNLHFVSPDHVTFPGISLALEAFKKEKTLDFIQANEAAVKRFAQGEISIMEIYKLIKEALK